jgi:hypothetical protein
VRGLIRIFIFCVSFQGLCPVALRSPSPFDLPSHGVEIAALLSCSDSGAATFFFFDFAAVA